MRYNTAAQKWAWDNDLRIFPEPLQEEYPVTVMVNGRRKKRSKKYCEIVIEISGRTKRVADLPHLHEFLPEEGWKFTQGEEIYKVIDKLYTYYYERHLDTRPS